MHTNHICPDCFFEKKCGDHDHNEECDFMKILEMDKLIQDETTKIKGIV